MSEHMLQSAMIAEKAKSSSSLVCASLLHDYGHFIIDDPDELVKNDKDGYHESIGYEYLKSFFKKEIVEPIKYHVLAKRYLARDKKYYKHLSDASKISLKLQGGILNKKESDEILNKIFEHQARLELTCRFTWTENTVCIWDNRSVIHFAIADFYKGRGLGYERVMDRIAIEGDQPR